MAFLSLQSCSSSQLLIALLLILCIYPHPVIKCCAQSWHSAATEGFINSEERCFNVPTLNSILLLSSYSLETCFFATPSQLSSIPYTYKVVLVLKFSLDLSFLNFITLISDYFSNLSNKFQILTLFTGLFQKPAFCHLFYMHSLYFVFKSFMQPKTKQNIALSVPSI